MQVDGVSGWSDIAVSYFLSAVSYQLPSPWKRRTLEACDSFDTYKANWRNGTMPIWRGGIMRAIDAYLTGRIFKTDGDERAACGSGVPAHYVQACLPDIEQFRKIISWRTERRLVGRPPHSCNCTVG